MMKEIDSSTSKIINFNDLEKLIVKSNVCNHAAKKKKECITDVMVMLYFTADNTRGELKKEYQVVSKKLGSYQINSTEMNQVNDFLKDQVYSSGLSKFGLIGKGISLGYSYYKTGTLTSNSCDRTDSKLSFVNWDCVNNKPKFEMNENVYRFIWPTKKDDYDFSVSVLNSKKEVCDYYTDYINYLLRPPIIESLNCQKQEIEFVDSVSKEKQKLKVPKYVELKYEFDNVKYLHEYDIPSASDTDQLFYDRWKSKNGREIEIAASDGVIRGVRESNPKFGFPGPKVKHVVIMLKPEEKLANKLSQEALLELNALKPYKYGIAYCCNISDSTEEQTACAKKAFQTSINKDKSEHQNKQQSDQTGRK